MNPMNPQLFDRSLLRASINRREMLQRLGLAGAGVLLSQFGVQRVLGKDPEPAGDNSEPMPTSPLILSPFQQDLPIPKPLPVSDPGTWRDPNGGLVAPGPAWQQPYQNPFSAVLPAQPVYYRIPIYRAQHSFTTSLVLPIDSFGNPVQAPFAGAPRPGVPIHLPASWMSCFNGTFPGPFVIARYGQPALVRFENLLKGYLGASGWADGADYGVPSALTHLHNAHTSPESDGNPNYCPSGYDSWHVGGNGRWCYDNLYLNYPPEGDDREKQSFFWFHDHRMNNTSANVYSGMVGLYFIYDNLDSGDETKGYRLPGVPDTDGSIKYDIPLAIFDARFDDGVTPHSGVPVNDATMPGPVQDGLAHPNRWGQTFFAHYPNQGFVGDVFTVNGTAFPVLRVKRRKYRFRFLDCSIARWYEFSLRQGHVVVGKNPVIGTIQQGQYNLEGGGTPCMKFVQVASEGGLLPVPITRNSFKIAPAKRREVVIDFTKYMDGTATHRGDEIYLTNTLEMSTGRKPDGANGLEPGLPPPTPNYAVPLMRFVIESDALEPDQSVIPPALRGLPPVPANLSSLTARTFELQRSGGHWMINGRDFDPTAPLANPIQGAGEVWTIANGGGGWVHPLHIHMEEHHVLGRNGVPSPDTLHPDDNSKEDVVALEPGEQVVLYRKFRSFKGPYVAHCHNLAHEDQAMMFGWNIV